jgi:hypothetical protein
LARPRPGFPAEADEIVEKGLSIDEDLVYLACGRRRFLLTSPLVN